MSAGDIRTSRVKVYANEAGNQQLTHKRTLEGPIPAKRLAVAESQLGVYAHTVSNSVHRVVYLRLPVSVQTGFRQLRRLLGARLSFPKAVGRFRSILCPAGCTLRRTHRHCRFFTRFKRHMVFRGRP